MIRQPQRKKTRELILDVLPKLGEWFTVSTVVDRVRIPPTTVRDVLLTLRREGYLERGPKVKSSRFGLNNQFRMVNGFTPQPIEPKMPSPVEVHDNVYQTILRLGHDEDFGHRPATDPTAALPGSKEKIAVMSRRIGLGQDPHHPLDARFFKQGAEPKANGHYGRIIGGIKEYNLSEVLRR